MNDLSPGFAQLVVDRASRTVMFRGREIKLSAREFAILEVLIERPGTPVSRMELRERLYGMREPDILGNPVQVHMHNLRAKLGEDVIQTVRGSGYVVSAAWFALVPAAIGDRVSAG
jgi:two-component system, OmpR family, response regulator QseB